MALVLELFKQGKEFVALFDHHDDLVVFVGEGKDSELSFCQVKSTSELTWTAKRLARRSPKGELPKSIVGKAYYNVAQFGPGIRRASILSNRPLSATLVTATKSDLHDGELSVADLCSADQETLMKSLEADTRRIIAPGHVAPKTNVVEGRKPPDSDAAMRAQHPAGADTQLGVALPATERRGGRNGRSLRHR
jgi:hypothetical protein